MGRPKNEKLDPIQASLFGLEAIVQISNALPNLILQALGNQRGAAASFSVFLYLLV
jgi:hypothetical protein